MGKKKQSQNGERLLPLSSSEHQLDVTVQRIHELNSSIVKCYPVGPSQNLPLGCVSPVSDESRALTEKARALLYSNSCESSEVSTEPAELSLFHSSFEDVPLQEAIPPASGGSTKCMRLIIMLLFLEKYDLLVKILLCNAFKH